MTRPICRSRVVGAALLAVVVSGLAACGGSGSAAKDGTVRVGTLATVTGDFALYGTSYLRGIEVAVDEHNQNGDFKIELVKRNPVEDPAENIAAIREFHADGIDLILNVQGSPSVMAAGPVAERNQQLMLSNATAATIPDIGEWVWQGPLQTATATATGITELAQSLGVKKIAMAKWNSDYGVSGAQAVAEQLEEAGIELVADVALSVGEKDFAPVVSSLRRSGADAYIVYAGLPDGALIAERLRNAGDEAPIIGTNSWLNQEFIDLVPAPGSDDVYNVVDYVPGEEGGDETTTKFVEDYQDRHGEEPNTYAANGYDQAKIFIAAMQAAHDEGEITAETVRAGLESLTFDGITGKQMSFGENRSILKEVFPVTVEDGVWVRVDR